jgi:hypothetical protein
MDTSSRFGLLFSFIASVIIVTGAAVLHSTILPDQPALAFFLSLASGTVATIILARSGHGPF